MKNKQRSYGALESLLRDEQVMSDLQANSELINKSLSESKSLGSAEGLDPRLGNEGLFDRASRLLEGAPSASDRMIFGEPEAIILAQGRPALLVQQGTKWQQSTIKAVNDRLNAASAHLMAALPKVGRVELLNHPQYDFVGTGWVIDENIIITNRHVAETFAMRQANRFFLSSNPDGQKLQPQIDFLEEHERPDAFEVPIEEIIFMEENSSALPDMAVMRLGKSTSSLPTPMEISEALPVFDADVAVIGYPAYDPRNDAFVMNRIFDRIYDVKRLSPGRISGVREDGSIIMHDCTTLGGNSGSLLMSLESGKALGLHFSGSFGVNNYAVSCAALRQRLTQVLPTRRFAIPGFARPVQTEDAPSAAPSPVVATTAIALAPAVIGFSSSEPRQPRSTGTGYNADFLGEGFNVPLPTPGEAIAGSVAEVEGKEDGALDYTHFSVVMNKYRRVAMFTAVNIDGNAMYNIRRSNDSWNYDDRLDQSFQAGNELYSHNSLDRGHLVRRLDPAWGGTREEAIQGVNDTFFFTNCAPQHSALNQHTWLSLEDHILDNAAAHNLLVNVFTGPVFRETDRIYRDVGIPEEFWKVVVIVNSFTNRLSATGYIVSQRDHISDLEFVFGAFSTYQVPIKTLENLTNLTFGALSDFDPLARNESVAARLLDSAAKIIL